MPVSGKKPGAGEILSAIGLWVLGFLLTAGIMHTAIRDPLHLHADVRSEKLVMLKEWQGKVFSAAFGSSHVHNGFDPRVFDRTLSGTPLATRSVNLAIEGGSQSEQRVMAIQFLNHLKSPRQAGAPSQPCLVLLELEAGANFTVPHLVHPRAINIYDWPTARLVTHFVTPGMSASQRYGRIGYALAAMALHYTNIGMLSNLIFTPPLSQEILTGQTQEDRRGELEEPSDAAGMLRISHEIAAHPKQTELRAGVLTPGHLELIDELAAASAVPGATFVYFVMPKISDIGVASDYPDHLVAAGRQVPILNLARPDRFPQLYNAALWHDEAHLTAHGAEVATALLAQELGRWYAAHGDPPPCGG